uniref:Succinate dehydrogenase subunit 4 n=1 Tax=Euonymus alatus TaxID=4307 RepID=A0A872PKX5_EUOAL|nr:succinate dehydrogenase subunit 4 [Euonymus alatus]QOX10139.1 succinate dehydrogenase subunit 4 [Euonymus alatus]
MVLAFCRRGSVIPICLYLLVGRYMKERKSGLRNESSKTKRAFPKNDCSFPTPFDSHIKKSFFHFPTKSLFILAHK